VNWSGFYVGGRIGVGNANHDMDLDVYDLSPAAGQPSSVPISGIDGWNSSGIIGGAQVGVDKQVGRFVFGVFGSYDWSNMETNVSGIGGIGQFVIGGPVPGGVGNVSLEKQEEWSLGGRAGVLVNPKTLVYLSAAYTETDYEFNGLAPGLVTGGFSEEQTFSGVSVGGGVEFALADNIFLGLDYTHTFYGDEEWLDTCNAVGAPAACDSGLRMTDSLDEDKVMATIKFKLNQDVFGN
jgi:outer membrane immunogenic protein